MTHNNNPNDTLSVAILQKMIQTKDSQLRFYKQVIDRITCENNNAIQALTDKEHQLEKIKREYEMLKDQFREYSLHSEFVIDNAYGLIQRLEDSYTYNHEYIIRALTREQNELMEKLEHSYYTNRIQKEKLDEMININNKLTKERQDLIEKLKKNEQAFMTLADDVRKNESRTINVVYGDYVGDGGKKETNNFYNSAADNTAADIDNKGRISKAIETTFSKAKITLKSEFLAIYQIIVEKNLYTNLNKAEFCRMVKKCNISTKPDDANFKNIIIRGEYPNWDVDNNKSTRYVEIAGIFLEEYYHPSAD